MRTVSSETIDGGHQRVLTGVIGAAALMVFLMAVFTLDGVSLVAALGIVVLLLGAVALVRWVRAEIAVGDAEVVLRFRPFYSTAIPSRDILRAVPSTDTSEAEGFGYRVLGEKRRGLLVRGPSLEITTPDDVWVVSCGEPDQIAALITHTPDLT